MTDEIAVSPAQARELRPAMAEFNQAKSSLIKLVRMIVANAGENPDRYLGNIDSKEDGSLSIPLAPVVQEVAPNRAERRRAAKAKPAAGVPEKAIAKAIAAAQKNGKVPAVAEA